MDPDIKEKPTLDKQNENRPVWTDDEWDNFNSEYSIG